MGSFPFAPVAAPPSGAAGGILGGTYPNPGQAAAAVAAFAPANPANTNSNTLVMMGLGSVIAYTPKSTGKIVVWLTGSVMTLTAFAAVTVGARFGTGAAPGNGVAVTGAAFGGVADLQTGSVTVPVSASFAAEITGLTPGTAYWFDIALATATVADRAQITNVMAVIQEAAA